MKNASFYLFILLFVCTLPTLLHAQEKDVTYTIADTAQARQLLEEAKKLTDERKYEEALEKAELAKEIYEKTNEIKDENAEVYERLGILLGRTQQYQTAYNNLQKALEYRVKLSNNDSLKVDGVLSELSHISFYLGNVDNALHLAQRSLNIRLKYYGEDNQKLAQPYNDIAVICGSRGEGKKAIEYLKKALSVEKSDTLGIAKINNNIGGRFAEMGMIDSASYYMKFALMLREKKLGYSNAVLVPSLTNLGTLAREKGNSQESNYYLLRGKTILESEKKPNLIHLGELFAGLGNNYMYLSEYQKAVYFYKKALAGYAKSTGLRHHFIVIIYQNLSTCYSKLKEKKLRDYFREEARKLIEHLYGNEHYLMANYHFSLSVDQHEDEDFDLAIHNLNRAIEICKQQKLEEKSSTFGTYYNNLGVIYSKINEFNTAFYYMNLALESDKELYGEVHPKTAESLAYIGDIFFRKKEYYKSVEYFENAIKLIETHIDNLKYDNKNYNWLQHDIFFKKGRSLHELFKLYFTRYKKSKTI